MLMGRVPPKEYSDLGSEDRIGAGSFWILPLFLEPVVEMIEAVSPVLATSWVCSSIGAMIWLGLLLLLDPFHVSCDHLEL